MNAAGMIVRSGNAYIRAAWRRACLQGGCRGEEGDISRQHKPDNALLLMIMNMQATLSIESLQPLNSVRHGGSGHVAHCPVLGAPGCMCVRSEQVLWQGLGAEGS